MFLLQSYSRWNFCNNSLEQFLNDCQNVDHFKDIRLDVYVSLTGPGGAPDDRYCDLAGGCENGGECYDQCRGFWCDCPKDDQYDYYGKRCELSKKKRK